MAAPRYTVTTPYGEFIRNTWNDYQVIAVVQMPHNDGPWAIWSRDLGKAQKNVQRLQRATVHGYYAVADGRQVAPGTTVCTDRRAARVAKPEVIHEYERCAECDRRHPPERVRCGNCWRCHEPATKCGTTKKEIAASIERHNAQPTFFKVQTNTWRPWNEAQVPQCDCHR